MQHISHTPLLHSSSSTSTSLLLLAINKNKTAWYTRIFWSISKCNFPFNYTKLNSVQHTRAINFTGLEARIKNDNNLVKLIASVWVRQSNLFLNPFFYFLFCSFIFLIHLRTLFNYFANHICRRIKINWREICIFIEHLLSDGWLADFHQPLWFSCIHKKKLPVKDWKEARVEVEREVNFPREKMLKFLVHELLAANFKWAQFMKILWNFNATQPADALNSIFWKILGIFSHHPVLIYRNPWKFTLL